MTAPAPSAEPTDRILVLTRVIDATPEKLFRSGGGPGAGSRTTAGAE
jgi:hypothetical protein